MREAPTLVAVGAGSAMFGLTLLHDVYAEPVLQGSTLWLVDLDPGRLDRMRRVAEVLEAASDREVDVCLTTERATALPGADVVVVSVAVNRDAYWLQDWEIPRRHGVEHPLGENAGPGGLAHAMRSIPLVAEIGRDVERLAPDAVLLNFTNPEGRICTAFRRHLDQPVIGLCHEVNHATKRLTRAWGRRRGTVRFRAAGLNHITWLLAATDTETGEDLTPRIGEGLDAVLAGEDGDRYRLVKYLFDRLGVMVATTDTHVGEYLPYAMEHVEPVDFPREQAELRTMIDGVIDDILSGTFDLPTFFAWPSWEQTVPIVRAAITGDEVPLPSAIVPNDGLVPALPADCAVEVSAVATREGIRGDCSSDLPVAVAALLNLEVAVEQLVSDAALGGSRAAALEALLLDPVVGSARRAEAILADFEEAYAGVWPTLH